MYSRVTSLMLVLGLSIASAASAFAQQAQVRGGAGYGGRLALLHGLGDLADGGGRAGRRAAVGHGVILSRHRWAVIRNIEHHSLFTTNESL